MKRKRLFALLTALVMLIGLLPAGTLSVSASESGMHTVLIGVIDYLYEELGDGFELHYWGGADGAGDASLNYADENLYSRSLGPEYWNGEAQRFRVYVAEIPDDATGFKLRHPDTDRWFGGNGDALRNDRVFVFEYGNNDLADYGTPITSLGSAADWQALTREVAFGLDYADRTVTMTADFSIGDEPIGSQDRPFRGVFDGGGKTLSVQMNETGSNFTAPFGCIDGGAVVRDLTVTGSVLGGWHSAGLVGLSTGGTQDAPNLVDNCRVSVDVGGGSYLGGVVGHGSSSCLAIRNTVYSGVLSDADSYCGGLQGWGDNNELEITNCLFCGSFTGSGSFDPIAVGCGSHSFTNAYYTGPVCPGSEGTPVCLSEPTDSLAVESDAFGVSIWIRGETVVEGVEEHYPYDGTLHVLSPEVRYDGVTLTEGSDYVWTVDGQTVSGVSGKGCYELTVTGVGAYSGSVSLPVAVVPDTLSGAGTRTEPRRIEDGADWIRFAMNVADGDDYRGEYVLLCADVPARMKVGTVWGSGQEHAFSGVFDGGGHTLSVDITDTENQGTAPFCYIEGATIKNLRVTGSVHGDYHSAGLVGFVRSVEDENQVSSQNRIENCAVYADVYSDSYLGGIVGHALSSELIVENCLYGGLLVGGGNAKGALLGWDDPGGSKTIVGCCYACREAQNTNDLWLVRGLSGEVTLTDCWRTTDACEEGVRVYEQQPPDCLSGRVSAAGVQFALPCEISGVAAVYNCAGGPVSPSPVVRFNGSVLTEGTDYALQIVPVSGTKSVSVSEPGSYELQISGVGAYGGTETVPFRVGSVTWTLEPDGEGRMTVLHISGVGPMEELEPFDGEHPRYDVPLDDMDDITAVVIDIGITDIGAYAFDGFWNLERATIPGGVTRVGQYAFTGSSSAFTELKLPAGLQSVERGAFRGLGSLTDVWCARTETDWWEFVDSDAVDTEDNPILTGRNDAWEPIDYHWSVTSDILFASVPHGGAFTKVNGQTVVWAGDGTLVSVVFNPDSGYLPNGLQIDYTDADGVTPVTETLFPRTEFTMPYASDVTVTPSFRPVVYSVRFDPNGGTGGPMPDRSLVYDAPQTLDANLYSRPGYSFDGWNTASDYSGTFFADLAEVCNLSDQEGAVVTFYAQWRPLEYLVRFDRNHADAAGLMQDQHFTYDSPQALSANGYSLTGYTFLGWNDEPDGSGSAYSDGETVNFLPPYVNAVKTLYAQWGPISYSVRFDPNGGAGGPMPDRSFVYDAPQTLNPNVYTRTGYEFAGWNTAADGSGTGFADMDAVLNLSDTEGGVVVLYAQWTPIRYTVHFDGNGAEDGTMEDQSFTYDQPGTLRPNAFSLTGYTFDGWTDAGGSVYPDRASVLNLAAESGAVVTLSARWAPNAYSVRFVPNAPTEGWAGEMPDQSFFYDTAQALNANAYTCTGYTFTGWNTAADGSGAACADEAAILNLTAEDGAIVTLYGQWRPNAYAVVFDLNGGDSGQMQPQSFTYDRPQRLAPSTLFRHDYVFDHWNTAPDGSGASYEDGALVSNLSAVDGDTVILYAQWVRARWGVYTDGSGCTVSVDPTSCFSGTTVVIRVVPDTDYGLTELWATYCDVEDMSVELPLTPCEEENCWSFVMPVGSVTVVAFCEPLTPFEDVHAESWFLNAVRWAVNLDITTGTSATTFSPGERCTRAQIVTFLYRTLGWAEAEVPTTTELPFTDVRQSAYYYDAVCWAVRNGVTTGTTATDFSPNRTCTRAQAVTLLWRAVGSPSPSQSGTPFDDVPANAWYAEAVRWAYENGITVGTRSGSFSPDASCTRAEIVTFLYRALSGEE